MLLKSKAGSIVGEPYAFDAVYGDCGARTCLFEDGQVAFEGRSISLAEFQAMIPAGPQ